MLCFNSGASACGRTISFPRGFVAPCFLQLLRQKRHSSAKPACLARQLQKVDTMYLSGCYSVLTVHELISKISRWCELYNFMPKSRAESRSKMQTNMASKFLKFVYRKCCVGPLRFQNICLLNRRPYLSFCLISKRNVQGMQEFQLIKLICSITTIIGRGKES